MKILHIGPVNPNRASGVSASILGLVGGQASLGCKIALLSSESSDIPEDAISQNVKLLPTTRHRNPWRISSEWIDTIKREFGEPDIVNIHDTYIPLQSALARLFERERWQYMLTPQGGLTRLAQSIKPLKKKFGNIMFMNHLVKNASAIHAVSQNEADDIKAFYPGARIFILPNGIDEGSLELATKIEPMDLKQFKGFYEEGDMVIGYIGRIDIFHKGIDLLLSSIGLLQNKGLGRKIKLVLVGPFHSDSDRIEINTLLGSLMYPENVMLTGPIYGEEKWRWLKSFHIFIHTSRFEGLPVAVLEAMACGKPCIVTPGSNIQDIISACNGGWLCDGTIDSIAQVIAKVEGQRDKISERGNNAKKYAKDNLTWLSIAKRSIEIMKGILS